MADLRELIDARRSADFRQMLDNGAAVGDQIQADALRIAEKMRRVHGGHWGILICHESQMVTICRNFTVADDARDGRWPK